MKQLRVLVADDNVKMRRSIIELLWEEFDIVGAAANGEELVLSAICLMPDVVVSDVLMPRMDGRAARNLLIAQRHSVAFVFVSGLTKDAIEFLPHGPPVAFVHKTEMVGHLSKALVSVSAGSNYLSPYYCEWRCRE